VRYHLIHGGVFCSFALRHVAGIFIFVVQENISVMQLGENKYQRRRKRRKSVKEKEG
jgi:hypothetical protein